MTEIFKLRKIQDGSEIHWQEIVKKYPSTPAFSFIQEELLELDWKKAHNLASGELDLLEFDSDILRITNAAQLLWCIYCTISFGSTYRQFFFTPDLNFSQFFSIFENVKLNGPHYSSLIPVADAIS